jgi:Ca2+-binding RTX toxin-like protein
MMGGPGFDQDRVDNPGDRIIETSGFGRDEIVTSVSYALPAGVAVELMIALTRTPGPSATLHLTGNETSQTLLGNPADNVLRGNGGNDGLFGSLGDDILSGGANNDRLVGGGGADVFLFDSPIGKRNVDRIADFHPRADDVIFLEAVFFPGLPAGPLNAEALAFGARATEPDHRIIYNRANGYLSFDADGSGPGKAVKFAVLENKAALQVSDFYVV